MSKTRARSGLASCLLLAAVLATACAVDEGSIAERSTDESVGAAAQDDRKPPGAEATASDTEDPSAAPGLATFADAIEYDDGLKVEVAAIAAATAGEWAIGAEATDGDYTRFDIRITNGSGDAFDATLVYPSVTYGEAGNQAEQVFDEEIGGGFSGVIPASKSQTATFGFAIPAAQLGDVTLQVELSTFEHDPAIFTGSVG